MNDMELQVDRDRWKLLMRVITEGPGMSRRHILARAGVNENIGVPGRENAPRVSTVSAVVDVVTDPLGVDGAQLAAWLLHLPAHLSLEDHLQALLTLRECRRCKGWFAKDQMIVDLGFCRRCARAKQSPGVIEWEHKVRELMPSVQDPLIRQGYEAVTADPQNAVKHILMAQAAGLPYVQWMKRWEAAGLPLKRQPRAGAGPDGERSTRRTSSLLSPVYPRRANTPRKPSPPRRRRSRSPLNTSPGRSSFLASSSAAAGCW